jgi:hypothetical protein
MYYTLELFIKPLARLYSSFLNYIIFMADNTSELLNLGDNSELSIGPMDVGLLYTLSSLFGSPELPIQSFVWKTPELPIACFVCHEPLKCLDITLANRNERL